MTNNTPLSACCNAEIHDWMCVKCGKPASHYDLSGAEGKLSQDSAQSSSADHKEMERLISNIEDSLIENENCKDCLNCAENIEYCSYHQKLFGLPRTLMERVIVLESNLARCVEALDGMLVTSSNPFGYESTNIAIQKAQETLTSLKTPSPFTND